MQSGFCFVLGKNKKIGAVQVVCTAPIIYIRLYGFTVIRLLVAYIPKPYNRKKIIIPAS